MSIEQFPRASVLHLGMSVILDSHPGCFHGMALLSRHLAFNRTTSKGGEEREQEDQTEALKCFGSALHNVAVLPVQRPACHSRERGSRNVGKHMTQSIIDAYCYNQYHHCYYYCYHLFIITKACFIHFFKEQIWVSLTNATEIILLH